MPSDQMLPRSAPCLPTVLAAASVAALTTAALSGPATAKPIEKGHFIHDTESHEFVCTTTGTPVREDTDMSGSFLFNQRAPGSVPHFQENLRGTVTWTNLDTGDTFTDVFTAVRQDHTVTDNGDGTITIEQYAAGGSRYYDQFGKLVLLDPGSIRFAFEIDLNGTPADFTDDFMVDDSFRVIRESTGRTDTTGDFCEDLVRFTSAP